MQPEDEAVGEVEHGLGVVGGQLGVAAVAVGAAAATDVRGSTEGSNPNCSLPWMR